MGENGRPKRFFTPLEIQRTKFQYVFKIRNRVRTKRLCLLLKVLLYSSSTWWLGDLVGGRVGRLVGWRRSFCTWVSAFVPVEGGVVIFFGTVFIVFAIPAYYGEVQVRTNASVCCCTAVAYGGLVGWWVDGLVDGWVCCAVRGSCSVGELKAGAVLVRLLCCVLLPSCLLLNAAAMRWVCVV